jgi:hypothetical protein
LAPAGGPRQFILHGGAGLVTSGMVASVAGYPPWLMVACAVLAALVALWLLVRLIKLALWILFFGLLFVGGTAAVWLLLR